MNLCSDGHEEICYEGRDCPLCVMKNDLWRKIYDKNKEIESLKKIIEQLDETLKDLPRGISDH